MKEMTAEIARIIVPLIIPAYLNMMGRLSIAAPSILLSRASTVVEEEFLC
jgi:hypothetical protein